MSTENAIITVRKRRVEIKLTFEFANHMMDNYIRFNPPHDLDFLQIQKLIRHCKWEHVRDRTYRGTAEKDYKNYIMFVILTPKFAVLKTCYYSRKL